MGENVVFDNSQAKPTVSGASEDNQSANVPPTPADVPAPAVTSGVPATETTEVSEAPPDVAPPGFPVNLLGGSLLKKILIGVGIFIAIIFIIFLLLPKQKKTQPVTITWWNLWEDPNVMQPILDDFHRLHPEITVQYVKQDPNNYSQRLLARLQNNTGPDIFTFHNTWLPIFSSSLLPLPQSTITPEQFQQTFYPVMQQDLVQNGAIYGIPLGVDTLALLVNTDLFKAAGLSVPRTWDDFTKAASKLTVKDTQGKIKTAGAALGTYDNVTHAPDIISLLFIQQGVTMKKFPTDTQNEMDALDFYTSFATGEQPVWDPTLDESKLAFAKGNVGMYFGFSWDVFDIQKLNQDLHFAVYQVPSLFNKNATIATYWAQGVSAKSSNQQAALLFLKYLLQKDTAQKLYTTEAQERGFGEPYARKDLADTLKNNALVFPFINQLPNATSSIFASDTQDGDGGINTAANSYLQNAVNNDVINHVSTASVIGTLDQGIGQIYQKYGIQ